MRRNHSIEVYEVGGERVPVLVRSLKRGVDCISVEEVSTEDRYRVVSEAVAQATSSRCSFLTIDEIRQDIKDGEDPHALKLIDYRVPLKAGAYVQPDEVTYYIDHRANIPLDVEYAVAMAPEPENRSRSDRYRATRLLKRMISEDFWG